MKSYVCVIVSILIVLHGIIYADGDELKCRDEELIGNSGQFSSVRYPDYVNTNAYCHYVIIAPPGKYVDLVIDHIEGYQGYSYYSCYDADEVLVYDYETHNLISYFCGYWRDMNRWIGESFYIAYDFNDGYSLMHGSWKMVDENPCSHTPTPIKGHMEGEIFSPGWPDIYYNAAECTTIIEVNVGSCIVLTFHSFEVEDDYHCMDDWLDVFDGDCDKEEYHLGYYCGYDCPEPIVTRTNYLRLVLVTDSMHGSYGYHATWKEMFPVYDFQPVKVKGAFEKNLRVYFELRTMQGMRIWDLDRIKDGPDCWIFTAEAHHMDACGASYHVYGRWINETGLIRFDLPFLPGRYEIVYHADGGKYQFKRAYTIDVASPKIMAIATNEKARNATFDFMLYEMYDDFTFPQLEQLRRNIRGYLQLKYSRDVYVVTVMLSMDYDSGYINARVIMRGSGLMVRLRKACAAIASPEPFRFCWDGEIKPIRHSRSLHAFGREFGYDTPTRCSNAMFVPPATCSCPCFCGGISKVDLFNVAGMKMNDYK